MKYETFQGHLLMLTEATNKELSDPLARLWWLKFGQCDEATFVAAIDRATDSCTWFPSPVEFAAILGSLMTPAERGTQEGIRLMRSWLSRGALPGCRDADEYRAIKAALGLPPPTADELARLGARRREVRRLVEGAGGDWAAHEALPEGPATARLLGADRPALASGRQGRRDWGRRWRG